MTRTQAITKAHELSKLTVSKMAYAIERQDGEWSTSEVCPVSYVTNHYWEIILCKDGREYRI